MISSLETEVTVLADPWPVIERFVHEPASWLPPPATPAGDDGWHTTLHVGVLHRGVEIQLGPVWSLPDAWVRRVRWVATVGREVGGRGAPYLPAFGGQFELRPDHDEGVLVTLTGHYVPPFGRLGAALDAVALHRVAQTTGRTLVTDVAERLASEGGAVPVEAPPARRHADV